MNYDKYAKYEKLPAKLENIDDECMYREIKNKIHSNKCIENDSDTASTVKPTGTSTSILSTGDGYKWKYMYTLSASQQTNFLSTDFMAVATNSTVSAAAVDGALSHVRIKTAGSGGTNGSHTSVPIRGDGSSGAATVTISGGAVTAVTITTAGTGYTNGTYYAAVYGDGTSAGTSSGAIIRITVASNQIQSFGLTAGTDTTIHSGGAAYTFGTVNLGSGYTFSDSGLSSASNMGGSGGAIEVVISPKNGHGNSAIAELGGHYVMSATTLTQAENDDITTSNDFRQVGLVVDPTNYGTSTVATASTRRQTFVVKASSVSGTFEVDEKITQATTGAVGKVVEYDSTLSLLYFQQERFGDFGTNSTTGDHSVFEGTNVITGATSSATFTPSSDSETITLANNNTLATTSGYANPELQPDSGNIVYLENRKPIQRDSDQTEDIKLIIEF